MYYNFSTALKVFIAAYASTTKQVAGVVHWDVIILKLIKLLGLKWNNIKEGDRD